MKRILFFIVLLLPGFSFGQSIVNQGSPTTITINKGGFQADSILNIPRRGNGTYYGRTGNIAIDNPTNKLKYHNGTQWVFVQDAGGGSGSVLADLIEADGNGYSYSITNPPIQNSVIVTVNGVEVKYSLSGLVLTINAPYPIDAADKVRIRYLYTP